MSYRIDYTAEIREEGRRMYIEHMRSQGYGGDNWDSLPSGTRELWAERAAKKLRPSSTGGASR